MFGHFKVFLVIPIFITCLGAVASANGLRCADVFSQAQGREQSFLDYISAKNLVLEAGIENLVQYRAWRAENNLLDVLPADPTKFYDPLKFSSNPLGQFLKSNRVHGRRSELLTYEEARSVVVANGIRTIMEYRKFRKENERFELPSNPDKYYEAQWKESGGARVFFNKFITFEVAQRLVQDAGIKNLKEFRQWRKDGNRVFIPADPTKTYPELQGVDRPLSVFLGLN